MFKLAATGVLIVALSGCMTFTPEQVYQSPYCQTDQRIVNTNGTVDSTSVVECTDRPSRRAEIQRAGIDSNCQEFWYAERRWGEVIKMRGVRCEKFDGTWEIIDINGSVY